MKNPSARRMSRNHAATPIAAVATSLALLLAPVAGAEEKTETAMDAHARLQHLHVLLHEGMSLVVNGSDLVMVANVGLEPSMDRKSSEHGEALIAVGRKLLESVHGALDGWEDRSKDTDLHDRHLTYTRKLHGQFTELAELLADMDTPSPDDETAMALHHMHMMVNQALRSAMSGANLGMLGTIDVEAADELSRKHSDWLFSNAKTTIARVLEGVPR